MILFLMINLLVEKILAKLKKCFCNWLLAMGDVEIAKKITFNEDMALVRERDNDDLREFIEYALQQRSNYYQEKTRVENLIINSSSIFERKLSVMEQKLLKELITDCPPLCAFSFFDRILSTKNSDEIVYNFQEYTPSLLSTFATLGDPFLEKLFSKKDLADIIASLTHWSPNLLRTFATHPLFLKQVSLTKEPYKVMRSLILLEPDELKTFIVLNPAFLDRFFSKGRSE